MFHSDRRDLGRWYGLAGVIGLLALYLLLLSGQVAAEQGVPSNEPPWRPQARGDAGAYPLSPTEQGDWDGFGVAWPCVISDTTSYRMWYNGFNPSNPGYGLQIGGAGSPDGTTWTKDPGNPVLGVGAPGEWDESYRGQTSCMVDGGTYKIWFTGGSTSPWQTGYATSSDGISWNVHAGNPVLPAGGAGSWDEMESSTPTVIKDGGTYKMWYMGCNPDYSVCSVGYATSADGVAWTKYAGNPVLTGTAGEWDEDAVWGPSVIKNGSIYMMWYQSDDEIGLATSPDGIDWIKHAGNPVLSEGWDGAGIVGTSVLLEGSTYKMWVRSGTGESDGIGYATSSDGITWMMYGGNPVLTPGDPGLFAGVNYDHDWVQVRTLPTMTVAITVADGGSVKATISGQTDEWGWFGTWDGDWDPERPDIMPGDIVSATGDGLTTEVDPVGTIDAAVDVDADTVAGTVHAPWFSPQTLEVRCEVWEENGPRIDVRDVAADGGSFTCDFGAIGWDLEAWQEVAVRYLEPDGDSVIGMPPRLQPSVTADYYFDWVNGEYEGGHTVWITVTESDGTTVKATAEVISQQYPEWGGWTGFQTQGEDWVPTQLDMQPGDWVDVLVDNGYGNQVRVGTIDGESDVDTDVVSGTIHAAWLLPNNVTVSCEIHEENGASIQVEDVDPDGGSFLCDFAGEWDILPGHNVAVNYNEPDTDRVQTHFIEPAPDMRVEKWPTGSDQVAPGGPIVYTIRYRNEGDAEATQVVLTDTLHPETSYGSDSSGVAHRFGTGSVIWDLGSVQPGEEAEFQLVLVNSAASGATLPNEVDIWTENDSDPDDNHAEAQVSVVDDVGNPYVSKNATPDRPAAGGTYLYEIDCGNNGPVAAGPVVLTDTLPANTHVVSWFSENGYELWTDMSVNGQLVLEAPALPGNWGDRIYLRLAVEPGVPNNTRLTNTVELDFPVGFAQHENSNARVDGPYWNSYVGKQFNWGQLVPGGQVEYNVHVRNFGNQATQTWLTDTLPAGTYFAQSWSWDGQTYEEFLPYDVNGQKVVWDMGQMLPGAWKNVDIRLDIDPGVQSGDVLTNCVEIGIDGDDGWPDDNQDCVADPVRGKGPNLRVYKEHEWQGDNQQLQYRIRVENIGTEWLENVWFTDTYPVDTTFSGEWWVEHGPWIELDREEPDRQLIFWAEQFWPGDSASIVVKVDPDDAGQPLRSYTNTVEVNTPLGDTNPGDNSDVDVAFSGGEVQWVDIDVYRTNIWGCAYDTPITVKTASAQLVIDGDRCWDEAFPESFLPGGTVTVTAGAGALPVVIEIPDPFTAYVSSENDQVWGQIDHLDGEMVQVDLWDMPSKQVQTDSDGNYLATYDDIPRGAEGDVNYRTEIDYADVTFHRRMDRLDLLMNINYDHDWVEGEYEADHTVWITVTESDGSTIKGSAVLTTGLVPWWDGQSGFSTNWQGWSGGQPDIMPGDWVSGSVSTGHTSAVKIGHVTGAISTLADRIRGTVDATWIGEVVDIECHPWGSPAWTPSKHDTVFPDGDDTYYCSWNPGTEWDVQKEQDLAVSYEEPTGDRVFAVFQIRAEVYLPVVLKNH
jgi:uncharacterized repeat protein (TIGR01451 family)